GRYVRILARGWWLIVLGIVLGAVVGYAIARGSGRLYTAKTTIYLGQPTGSTGSALQTLSTNPSTVNTVIHSDLALAQASSKSGIPIGKLRGGVSSQAVSGNLSKLGQTPLVTIKVSADATRAAVSQAADELARIAIGRTSGYPDLKRKTLEAQIAQTQTRLDDLAKRLAAINASLRDRTISSTDKLVLVTAASSALQQQATLQNAQLQAKLQLVQVQKVEIGHIVIQAHAVKTAARSVRNSAIVGAVIGLIAAAIAAFAVLPRRRRGVG
ncbi:MAG: Wzz/FepE/Etk N-terminal domain-containing protein, partial [Gaiellaceae bacterium]